MIVASVEDDILGGLCNALDRGQDLIAAQRSFINAGYPAMDVANAAIKVRSVYRAVPSRASLPAITQAPFPVGGSARYIPARVSSATTLWVLSILAGLILLTALFLGIFWEALF